MATIPKLTPEQREAFKQEILAEERNKEQNKIQERATYKELKNETVESVFAELEIASANLQLAKEKYYANFDCLQKTKAELYGIKDGQRSHTWTNKDSTKSIVTGFNVKDGWEDTLSVGLKMVDDWLDKQAGEENKTIVALVRQLLGANKEGSLDASRVLVIKNTALEQDEKELVEAVSVVLESHKLVKSSTFIKAQYVDDKGIKHWLPLSFSNV